MSLILKLVCRQKKCLQTFFCEWRAVFQLLIRELARRRRTAERYEPNVWRQRTGRGHFRAPPRRRPGGGLPKSEPPGKPWLLLAVLSPHEGGIPVWLLAPLLMN